MVSLAVVQLLFFTLAYGCLREGRAIASVVCLIVGAGAASYLLGGLFRRPDERIWISDCTAAAGHDDAKTLRVSAVRALEIRYEYPPLDPHAGWLELVTLHDDGQTLIFQEGRLRHQRLVRTAEALAERWHVPLKNERQSVEQLTRKPTRFEWLLLVTLSAAVMAFGANIAQKQWRMGSWPSTPAQVVAFDANIREAADGIAWHANPQIEFVYTVNDLKMTGRRLNPSPFNYQRNSTLAADTKEIRPGATVACWYNPRRPDEAYVVNSGITIDAYLVIAAGVALLVAGVVANRRLAALAAFVRARGY